MKEDDEKQETKEEGGGGVRGEGERDEKGMDDEDAEEELKRS